MSKKQQKPPVKSGIKTWQKIAALIIIIAIAAFFILPPLLKENSVENQYVFKQEGELTFHDSSGTPIKTVKLEIADNDYERQLGLMFRERMSEDEAMLFIFPYQTIQSFWMRNTKISLDILFVNNDRKIVTIHKGTDILSDQSYPSSEPSIYVVEVIAGFTEKYNILEGDSISWKAYEIKLP